MSNSTEDQNKLKPPNLKAKLFWMNNQIRKTIVHNLKAIYILALLIIICAIGLKGTQGTDLKNQTSEPVFRHEEAGPVQIGEIEQENINLTYLDGQPSARTIQFPNASYIKIHFSQLDLLPGDYLTLSDPTGNQIHRYPGSLYTTDQDNGFWALSILGDTVVIQLHTDSDENLTPPNQSSIANKPASNGGSLKNLGVKVDRYARGYPKEEIQSLLYGIDSTCGTNERTDVVCYQNSHPTEFEKSHAVTRLLINSTSLCTGWRTSPQNRLFTNEHCVTSQADVSATEVWFNYQRLVCGSGGTGMTTIVTGDTFLTDNYDYDFALFTLNNFESISSFGYLEIDPRTPVLNEEIYIPQHGNGNPKEFGIESDMDTGNVCRIDDAIVGGRVSNSDTGYYCDTIGGSSGSPVLARSNHKVIAIHHFGISGSTCTSSNMNQGVRMDLIWPLVEQYFESPAPSAPTNLSATPVSSTQIDLTWDDNASDETGYHIERSPSGTTGWTEIDTVGANTTTYSDFGLECDSEYFYRVRAFRLGDNQFSGYSNISSTTTYGCHTFNFTPGWNLITLTFEPINPIQAQSLLDLINVQGGDCSEIDRWLNGGWNAHIDGEGFNNFDIFTGEGYFIKCTQSGNWTLEGITLSAGVSLELIAGWNLIGVPHPVTGYTAQSLLDAINSQGGACSEIDRWLNGGWNAHIDGVSFNNFDIIQDVGYFLKCSQISFFTP